MAKSVGKSPLSNVLKKHATDPTEYGGAVGQLPPGINRGIAQLTGAKVGAYQKEGRYVKAGEKFVNLIGTVIEPVSIVAVRSAFVDGKVQVVSSREERIEGLLTSQTLPLCDTTNAAGETTSADENVATALNELRKIGGDESTAEVEDEESLQAVLDSLTDTENPCYFHFSTNASTPNKDYPTERVWERWQGCRGLEDYLPEESEAVEDETEEEEEPKKSARKLAKAAAETEPEGDDDIPFDPGEAVAQGMGDKDLEALAVAADANDADAVDRLVQVSEQTGVDHEKYGFWGDFVAAVLEARGAGEEEDEEEEVEDEEDEEEDWEPAKGEVYEYKPPKAKNPIKVEVTAVFIKQQRCNVKSLKDGKTIFKNVQWDRLEYPED